MTIINRIITFLFLSVASMTSFAQEQILVYTGPGAGPKSIANTLATIKILAADKYVIKTVGPEELIENDWLDNTALLVMPGGADRPYLERLGGKGNANIREFVHNGGNYLGICAGAYYSADRIEFAKGDVDLEVTGKRELKFFPGLVEGPTYSGFDHRNTDSVSGMRAATIHWTHDATFANDKDFVLFYNGGGHFVDAEQFNNVTILARYAAELPNRPNSPAAIVECHVGEGKAVLSGPHFEWFAESLEDSEHEMVRIKQKLSNDNANRMELAKHLLARLNIETK